MRLIAEIRPTRYLQIAILALVSLSFLNMLYCTMAYEFGSVPMTVLVGPGDRFADLVKLSLSFRSVTRGMDKTTDFQSWKPLYQDYYRHPDYGGVENLALGKLTHFHHPPLSTLLFLLCGIFIVHTSSPPLALFLFFSIYLFEVWGIIAIGIPQPKRTLGLVSAIWFLCLASYPALLTFGRANYVNAGLSSVPIIVFLISVFASEQAGLASLLALAIAVNIHPNSMIFLLALPLVLGARKAIKPTMQFVASATAIFIISYFAAHRLYPDYTITNFRKGVEIYEKFYISGGAGVRMGSSLFGFIRAVNRGAHLGLRFPVEITTFYVLALFLLVLAGVAFWTAFARPSGFLEDNAEKKGLGHCRGLAPFLLVSLYCILSPVFADYHLLVFIAPLVLGCLDSNRMEFHSELMTLVLFTSVLMLSPKNYYFLHASIQVILNPLILCTVIAWLSIVLLSDDRQRARASTLFGAAEG